MTAVLVVKLGGNVVAGEALAVIARELAALSAAGERVVVVHGGGPQISALQHQLGQQPRRIAGRRVTDECALDAMKMVVGGKLNVDLCAALLTAKARPVGLHGASALLIEAVRRPPRVISGGGPEPVDLGLVGDVVGVNRDLLATLLDQGYLPVLACIGASADGRVFNINADVVANRLAVQLQAKALVLVSDTVGVLRDRRDPTSCISELTEAAAREAITRGVVSEGMIPKLEESYRAIAQGVARVHIVGSLSPGDLPRAIAQPGSVGTVLLP